jgi:DNA-binding beta-propeller fold protein YncE
MPPELEVQEVADTGSMPKGAVLSPDGKRFYVTNFGMANGRNVTVFDAATLALVDTINLPGIAVESILSGDGTTLYTSNFLRDSVHAIDLKTRRVKKEYPTGSHPKILALSRDGKTLFAANWNGRSVTQIDVDKGRVVRTLATGLHPRGMAITAAGTLYVANFDEASIDVFTAPDYRWATRYEVCKIPRHLALSPDDKTLYISCYHDSELHAFDVETGYVTHRVAVGTNPKSIEVSHDGRYVFSADYGEESHSVSVVDTTDWTARIFVVPGMDRGSGIAIGPDGAHALVTGWYDNHVYLVGFTGTGGHPQEALKKIDAWAHRRHYHPPADAPGGEEGKADAKRGT